MDKVDFLFTYDDLWLKAVEKKMTQKTKFDKFVVTLHEWKGHQ